MKLHRFGKRPTAGKRRSAFWLLPLALGLITAGCEKPESTRTAETTQVASEPAPEGPATARGVNREPAKAPRAARAPNPSSGEEKLPLPVEHTLTDQLGRRLPVVIIGKNVREITAIRQSDQVRFQLSLEKLSEIDQDWLRAYADRVPPEPDPAADRAADDPLPALVDRQYEAIQRNLDRVEEKIEELNLQLADPTLGAESPRRRGIQTEVQKLRSQKIEYELTLKRLERKQLDAL